MRKLLALAWGAIVAVFGLFGVRVGVDISKASVIIALLMIALWVVREARIDWAELRGQIQQTNRWADPSFWVLAIGSVVTPILGYFKVELTESITTVAASLLAIVAPIIIGLFTRKTTAD